MTSTLRVDLCIVSRRSVVSWWNFTILKYSYFFLLFIVYVRCNPTQKEIFSWTAFEQYTDIFTSPSLPFYIFEILCVQPFMVHVYPFFTPYLRRVWRESQINQSSITVHKSQSSNLFQNVANIVTIPLRIAMASLPKSNGLINMSLRRSWDISKVILLTGVYKVLVPNARRRIWVPNSRPARLYYVARGHLANFKNTL